MGKGVIMLATGHKNYGMMAAVLAVSIRARTPEMPITLICNSSVFGSMETRFKQLFTDIVVSSNESFSPGRHKLELFKHSQYEETIFIDADSQMSDIGNMEDLFRMVSGGDFYITAGERLDPDSNLPHFWADLNHFKKFGYKAKVSANCQSSMFYFRKTERIESLFESAIMVYNEVRDNGIHYNSWLNGHIADEMCIVAGAAIAGVEMPDWIPGVLMLESSGARNNLKEALYGNQIVTFCTGNGRLAPHQKKLYNDLHTSHCRNLYKATGVKIMPFYKWTDKANFQSHNTLTRR